MVPWQPSFAICFSSSRRRRDRRDVVATTSRRRRGSLTVGVVYKEGTDQPQSISWTEDGGSTQTLGYIYDGPLITEQSFGGVVSGKYTYTYDQNLLVSSYAVDGGTPVVIQRDKDGRVTGEGIFSISTQEAMGTPVSIGDGVLDWQYTYDAYGRAQSHSLDLVSGSYYSWSVVRDTAGRIVSLDESVEGVSTTETYDYDADGQLTEVRRDGVLEESYGYDQNFNRTTRQLGGSDVETALFTAGDSITNHGDVVYAMDANGYLASRGGWSFIYSLEGDLLEATDGTESIVYVYDGLGRRVARTDSGGTTEYFYGDLRSLHQVTAIRTPDGVFNNLYWTDQGFLYSVQRDGVLHYVGCDPIGTPRIVVDGLGNVVAAPDMDTFGNLQSSMGEPWGLLLGFAGGIPDPETGLVRFGVRDYDPTSGRWTSRDPMLFYGGLNLFVYGANDPINHRDPAGKLVVVSTIVIAGLAITAIDAGLTYYQTKSVSKTAWSAATGTALTFTGAGASVTAGKVVGKVAKATWRYLAVPVAGTVIDVGKQISDCGLGSVMDDLKGNGLSFLGRFASKGIATQLKRLVAPVGWIGSLAREFGGKTVSKALNKLSKYGVTKLGEPQPECP